MGVQPADLTDPSSACGQCGFRFAGIPVVEIAGRLRAALAGASPKATARRPEPGVWSALEYGCHVRDVLLIQRDRAVLAQVEDRPSVARMYRDERVALCGYAGQPAGEVLAQLAMAAELCALVFGRLDDDAWSRRLIYNWPAAAEQDLAWLGRHTLHEVEHHLRDITDVLARVATEV